MKHGRAVVATMMGLTLIAGAIAACKDETSSTFDESQTDAGLESGLGFNTDATAGDDARPVDCNPALPTTFAPTWSPPTKTPAACSTAEMNEYYDFCFVGAADAGGCQGWRESHPACTSCIEPANNNGPIQLYAERKYSALNIGGCLSLVRGEPDAGSCASSFAASVQCQRESCVKCLSVKNVQTADFQSCQAEAKTSGCATLEGAVTPACGAGYKGPDGGAYACFAQPGDNNQQKPLFLRVMGTFCGP